MAELQERLAALGFDPGRVDGIYGAATRAAVAGFQRDAGLPADGVAGPMTLLELRRLAARHQRTTLVNEVKERVRRGPGSLDTLVVAVGQAGGLETVVEGAARALRARGAVVVVVREADEGPIAASANASTARCLVVVRLDPGATAATALYFATQRSESPAGILVSRRTGSAMPRAVEAIPSARPARSAMGSASLRPAGDSLRWVAK